MNKKRLAVVAGGWHFPLHFYEQIKNQEIPVGWEVDLFCVSHRNPDLDIIKFTIFLEGFFFIIFLEKLSIK